jgi:hypothetical protein
MSVVDIQELYFVTARSQAGPRKFPFNGEFSMRSSLSESDVDDIRHGFIHHTELGFQLDGPNEELGQNLGLTPPDVKEHFRNGCAV